MRDNEGDPELEWHSHRATKLMLLAETTDEADARRMFDEMMTKDLERDGPDRLHGRSPTRSWWWRRRRSPQLYIYSGEFYSGGGDMDPRPCALDSRMRKHGMCGVPTGTCEEHRH